MKYLSIGTDKLFADLHQPIKNGNIKPTGGLWATQYDANNPNYNIWLKYLSTNTHILFYKRPNTNPFLLPGAFITLKDDANIYNLTNIYKLEFLKKNYPDGNDWIDFEKLSADFDGIYIDIPAIYPEAQFDDKKRIGCFSVNTLIIFDLKCIDYYQSAQIDIDPFDYEFERHFETYRISVANEKKLVVPSSEEIQNIINEIKKKNIGVKESVIYETYQKILIDYINKLKDEYNCSHSLDTIEALLVRHITRSI